jgi:hypothetical protein
MTEPDDQTRGGRPSPAPRPAARPRPTPGPRPAPRPRVAGSRREREDAEPGAGHRAPEQVAEPAPAPDAAAATGPDGRPGRGASARRRSTGRPTGSAAADRRRARRRGGTGRVLALVLAVLCVLSAAGGGWLLWQRLHPAYVDSGVLAAARSGVEALYAYDYQDSDGSVQRKLGVLTGDLREQYRQDLGQGGIIDTYQQVSATTSYDVLEVGLQQVNGAQDQATVIVFGSYVVKSVNSGSQAAPAGSECQVTAEGAQACTQTVRMSMTKVQGDWKISELTLLTTS